MIKMRTINKSQSINLTLRFFESGIFESGFEIEDSFPLGQSLLLSQLFDSLR